MPDIFGRQPGDYQLIRDLHKRGQWDAYQAENSELRFGSPKFKHDFNALGAASKQQQERAAESASASGFLTNNMLAIQTMVDEIMFTAYRLPMFVSINTNIPEGATSYGVRVRNREGRARRISGPGYDAPSATAGETLVTRPIHWYGLDAEWSVDELRGSMFGGFPLDTESIDAAVTGSLETMEAVALVGADQATTGSDTVRGLCNQLTTGTGAVRQRASVGTFANAATPEIIRNEINGEISAVIENSYETMGRNINTGLTVYLPGTQYDLLTTIYIGDHAERTLMDSIIADNPWTHFTRGQPIMIHRVLELDSALNPNVTQDRMIVTLNNSRIAEMGVSIMPRVLDIRDMGRVVCAQVESKYSDLFVKRPQNIHYVDNV
jgi:hypothetical protein